ncbi:LysR family transcriptional regulator [Bradyrhizobium viridifuturi]|nr:LysR family transcriptional regulator [Bradyrhizobium viridifuturi]MBR1048639.1 LysR family transcriptional regulator [Bradyrhizobium viridifuturi]MBR1083742.1 LysR family transcriptional regulator [Bradyrhizobium viridifuturi]MBR1099206.1 LysR family transcriptional regulator [Bradyrhizobium viridifuturi]MBR1106362.1 LysR family transcriptional regulator [Bradyrhizobium viridifuturi]
MDLELRDLRLAVTASQHRSLRQAAEALNIRQSTLSRRLRDIERRLGVVLFERTNGGTHLTAMGLEFIVSAQRILDEVDTELRRLKSRSRGELGLLTIGVHASPSAGNMRAALVEYHRRFPDVEVRTVDGSHDRLLRALAGNAVDIAIMTGQAAAWNDRMLPLWSERVIAAFHENHPLARNPRTRWTDLADEKFLLPQQGPGPELEKLLVAKLRNAVGSERVVHQDSSLDRLLSLVGAGYGALLMFEGATGARYEGVVYREVWDDDGPTRVNFMAYWREANSNPTLGSFLAVLREHYLDLSAEPGPT